MAEHPPTTSTPDPEAVRVPEAFGRTRAFLSEDHGKDLHHGFQLFASVDGVPVADFAYGQALGLRLTPGTPLHWLCASKPLTSVSVALLVEAGVLRLDDPVTRFLPEYGQAGKAGARIGDLLAHTVPYRDGSSQYVASLDWQENLAAACAAPIDEAMGIGSVRTYSAWINSHVLAEVVSRARGEEYGDFLRREVLVPLGMDRTYLGMTAEEYAAVADDLRAMTYGGVRNPGSGSANDAFVMGVPELRAASIPGIGAMGTMRDLARLYEAMLGHGPVGGEPAWQGASALLRRRHLVPEPPEDWDNWSAGWAINSMNWSQGFVTDRGMYCPEVSPRVFGQPGEKTVMAMADADSGLVLAFSFNSFVSSAVAGFRMTRMCQAMYGDLVETGVLAAKRA
ncbi:serine hydrolase domain-containing protein [Streptomyces sp. NPDC059104]|uniref:serine hydrolase domain-containing protein n=1 Tax=Streptomyces sp. NPDC059104 TaxID=3346729 RepID=UPI003693C8C9